MPPQGQSLWNFRHENIIYQDTSCPIDYCPQHWRFYLMKVPVMMKVLVRMMMMIIIIMMLLLLVVVVVMVMVMGCWCWCWWILEALVFFMAARAIWQSNMACWQIPPSTLMIFPARNLHLDSLHQFSHYYIYIYDMYIYIYNIIYIYIKVSILSGDFPASHVWWRRSRSSCRCVGLTICQVRRCKRCPATGSEVPHHQVSVFQAAFKIANSPDVQMGLVPIFSRSTG